MAERLTRDAKPCRALHASLFIPNSDAALLECRLAVTQFPLARDWLAHSVPHSVGQEAHQRSSPRESSCPSTGQFVAFSKREAAQRAPAHFVLISAFSRLS